MMRSRRLAANLHDLRRAASNLPDAVVLLDQDQHVRWFNHAAESLLGLRRPQDRGVVLRDGCTIPNSPAGCKMARPSRSTMSAHRDSRAAIST
jgi:PAS domain-containing protein